MYSNQSIIIKRQLIHYLGYECKVVHFIVLKALYLFFFAIIYYNFYVELNHISINNEHVST